MDRDSCPCVTFQRSRRSLKTEQQRRTNLVISTKRRECVTFWSISITAPISFDRTSLQVLTEAYASFSLCHFLHRKEVIQPHLPIRLPCYDLTPIIESTFGSCLLAVSSLTSGVPNFHGLTGGVYKARERIHRGMLIHDY